MRNEIFEQPAALGATIGALLPRTAEVAALAQQTRQVLFFARGTSDNAAVYGTYLLQTRTGRLASLGSPSVATTYRSRIDLSGVMAVGLSQSGRTEEIIETLQWARDCGASIVGITNGAGSPLAELSDVALVTEAGQERAVPATKTFTCQLAALAVLAIGLGADLDAGQLKHLPAVIEDLLVATTTTDYGIEPVVAELANVDGLMVSARGLAYSAALEVALKIKEACYLHAMGISWADLQHGPIAVVDAKTPAIIMSADAGPTQAAAVGPGPAGHRRRCTRVRDRRRRRTRGGEQPRPGRPGPARVARADRTGRPRTAADRAAVASARHRPRQPARPVSKVTQTA